MIDKQNKAEKLHEEMIKVVKSEEAKKAIERSLIILDRNAFSSEGIIQSYEVDYTSISKNPMGGIMLTIHINGKEELDYHPILMKYDKRDVKVDSSSYSPILDRLLQEGEEKGEKNVHR